MKTVTATATNNTSNAGVMNLPTLEIIVFGRIIKPIAIKLKMSEKRKRTLALSSTKSKGNQAIS